MTLLGLRDLLLEILPGHVHHGTAADDAGPQCIVWQEITSHAARGDGKRKIKVHHVQVDLYTKIEFDTLPERIMDAFEEAGIIFEEPVVTYDKDAFGEWERYIWDCEVV